MHHLTVLYSHVLSFYIIDLTTVFYVYIDIFKKIQIFYTLDIL